MDTEFEEVVLCNFGPFTGEHTLILNNGASLNFVKGRNEVEPRLGSNGAGKSKLLNSIPWCLYGKTTDDLGSTDIRPWGGKGKTSVTLKLTVWDGDEGQRHKITRTAGPNSLTLDGKPCSQDVIDNLIGMPLAVFRLAPFLGQGQLLFHDLPNREKLDFLVGVLRLTRWDEYSDRARDMATALGTKLTRINSELDTNHGRAAELGEQVQRQKAVCDAWEAERSTKLKQAEKDTKALAKQADEATLAHGAISIKLDEEGLKLKLTTADTRELVYTHAKAHQAHEAAMAEQIAAAQRYEEAAAQLAVLKKVRQCPTCGGTIKRESTYLENVQRVEGKIRQYAEAAKKTTVRAAKVALDIAKEKADRHAAMEKQLQDTVFKLTREEQLLRSGKEQLWSKLSYAKRTLAQFETDANPHRDRLAELRSARKRVLDAIDALGDQRTAMEAELESVRYWVKGFKDVRLHILQEVLQELEFATNAMLDDIGLVGWEVQYAIERETKAGTTQRGLITTVVPALHDPRRERNQQAISALTGVKFKSWSGGEGQRLRIAGALALSEVLLARAGVECNIEVLDEPTRHLSSEGVGDLCEFLVNRAHTLKKSIYLVDHKAIESTYFDRIITVHKTVEGSSIG